MKKRKIKVGDFESTIITGDYNKFKKAYERLWPDIKRIFSEEGMPIPDDPYKLLDEILFRGFDGEENPTLNKDDFFNFAMRPRRSALSEEEEKELREMIREYKGNKSSIYGHHSENREWVKSKWNEIREGKPSDRQADFEIQKLYKDKFNGLSISRSQIQRFTGRQ